jgi:uncharacterized phage-associated protein
MKKTGVPPLELEYQAWEKGPVPYKLRDAFKNNEYSSELIKYTVEERNDSKTQITISPAPGKEFNLDYFSENEIEEMFDLIEIFADAFVKASDMSEASHKDILSWQRAWRKRGNKNSAPMDFAEEFFGDVRTKPDEKLSLQEEMFLAHEACK